jgi:hypothetical protein
LTRCPDCRDNRLLVSRAGPLNKAAAGKAVGAGSQAI